MINFKALALTALAATTLTFAAPKAEAGVMTCDAALKNGYAATCFDPKTGDAFDNAQLWANGGNKTQLGTQTWREPQGNAAQAAAVINHILTTPAHETAVPTTNVDRDCFINGQAYCINGPQTNQW